MLMLVAVLQWRRQWIARMHDMVPQRQRQRRWRQVAEEEEEEQWQVAD